MRSESTAPLAGFFRVLYFIAVTIATVAVVATAVDTFFDRPGNSSGFDHSEADFVRDTGFALSLVGTGAMVVAILALGSRFNALRSGLLFGGVLLFLSGVGGFEIITLFEDYREERPDEWLSFAVSCLAFVTLVGSSIWLEEGLPVSERSRRRAERPNTPSDNEPPPPSGPMN